MGHCPDPTLTSPTPPPLALPLPWPSPLALLFCLRRVNAFSLVQGRVDLVAVFFCAQVMRRDSSEVASFLLGIFCRVLACLFFA